MHQAVRSLMNRTQFKFDKLEKTKGQLYEQKENYVNELLHYY